MGDTMFKKCRIKDGQDDQVCWLPEHHAVSGGLVKISGKNWYVIEVGDKRLTEEELKKFNNEYKFYSL